MIHRGGHFLCDKWLCRHELHSAAIATLQPCVVLRAAHQALVPIPRMHDHLWAPAGFVVDSIGLHRRLCCVWALCICRCEQCLPRSGVSMEIPRLDGNSPSGWKFPVGDGGANDAAALEWASE